MRSVLWKQMIEGEGLSWRQEEHLCSRWAETVPKEISRTKILVPSSLANAPDIEDV